MLAVILMAAACSSGTTDSSGVAEATQPAGDTMLALRAVSAPGETLKQIGAGSPAHLIPLEGTLADMLGNPGSAVYRNSVAGWSVPTDISVATIYRNRGNRPIWVSNDGRFTPRGALLIDRLTDARVDALDPTAYRTETIRNAMAQGDAVGLSAAELMLSEALVRYSADLWDKKSKNISLLARASLAEDFSSFLRDIAPADPTYGRLRDALGKYNAIVMVGGWETIPGGGTLRSGASDSRVPSLRRRLALSGDLPEDAETGSAYFDGELEKAVKRFQARHGLAQDGAVGAKSLAVLNVPAKVRVEQLAENLRLQRKPESRFGDRAIVVNIAAYELVMFDGGREILRSRTIVGLPDWETPRLVSELKWLEINPTWSVPRNIAVKEIMPKLRRDGIEYLDKRGFRLFDAKSQELDSGEVDLAAIKGDALPFILRQDPGPRNPLGNVKFNFPNGESIYLHDTPSRRLFKRTDRAISHGCVRVEAAAKLAMSLLREEGWTQADYDRVLKSGKTYRVKLNNPMPIHIITRTAWVEADNSVQFRNDPYENGQSLQLALN
jgi:murein L,D-transpeptidase YcbB/YkuD